MPCSGKCCERFTLVVDGKPLTHAEWRLGGFVSGDLATLAYPSNEETRFNCQMFNAETRLCMDYQNRPKACREFPYRALQGGLISNQCQHCDYCQETAIFEN